MAASVIDLADDAPAPVPVPRRKRRLSRPEPGLRRKVACLDLTEDDPVQVPAPAPKAQSQPEADTETPFTCLLCFEEVPGAETFRATACSHGLCGTCARNYVLDAIKSSAIPITCPLCKAGDKACTRGCMSRKAAGAPAEEWCCSLDADLWMLLTAAELGQYHQRACSAAALRATDLRPCPAPQCQGIAVRSPGSRALMCCVCETRWCGTCNTPDLHPGKTCEQLAQERSAAPADAAFEEYRRTVRTVSCPNCSHALQRTHGCNRLRCMCGTQVRCLHCAPLVRLQSLNPWRAQLCWLCGTQLDRSNPYSHYTVPGGACFQKVHT